MINRIITGRTQFNPTELDALRSLRTQYQTGQHVFTPRELARLRFVRWLVKNPGWDRSLDQADGTTLSRAAQPEAPTWTLGFAF
jgi:hypothetical protein